MGRRFVWAQDWGPTTAAAVDSLISKAVQGGFTDVIFGFWSGGVSGFDVYSYAIQRAHANGMKAHHWAWVGEWDATRYQAAWNVATRLRSLGASVPTGWAWLDFANVSAQNFLISEMQAIMNTYPWDGYHLDCIRYESEDYYSYLKNGNEIGTTVQRLYAALKAMDSAHELTAAVAPTDWQDEELCQRWTGWCNNGYVDFCMPMSYLPPSANAELADNVSWWRGAVSDDAKVIPGQGSRYDMNNHSSTIKSIAELQTQITITQASGFALFQLTETSSALLNGIKSVYGSATSTSTSSTTSTTTTSTSLSTSSTTTKSSSTSTTTTTSTSTSSTTTSTSSSTSTSTTTTLMSICERLNLIAQEIVSIVHELEG